MTKLTVHPSLQRVLITTGKTPSDIAQLLGISLATVNRWAKQGISPAGAKKLGKLFDLDPDWILGNAKTKTDKSTDKAGLAQMIAKEALLEFVETEEGALVLREVGKSEAWVSIQFADKIKEMIGEDNVQMVGQHMIQAGIASFMQQQMRQWHAHVYDEVPKHFS